MYAYCDSGSGHYHVNWHYKRPKLLPDSNLHEKQFYLIFVATKRFKAKGWGGSKSNFSLAE